MNKSLLMPLAIIIAGGLIAGGYVYINQTSGQGMVLSPQEAAEIAIAFINKNIQENVTASLLDVAEESGVYKIHLKIEDNEYNSYITKDGKFLFSSAIILAEQPSAAPSAEVNLEALAKCLTEKGAKFYGAFWCGVCQNQKELFGEAAAFLPYIECVNEESGETASACQEAGITGYPTWEFNGEKNPGFKTLEQLAELSGCSLQ